MVITLLCFWLFQWIRPWSTSWIGIREKESFEVLIWAWSGPILKAPSCRRWPTQLVSHLWGLLFLGFSLFRASAYFQSTQAFYRVLATKNLHGSLTSRQSWIPPIHHCKFAFCSIVISSCLVPEKFWKNKWKNEMYGVLKILFLLFFLHYCYLFDGLCDLFKLLIFIWWVLAFLPSFWAFLV